MHAQEVCIDRLGGDEVLDNVGGPVWQHGRYGYNVSLIKKRWNQRGTELMANRVSCKDAYGLFDRSKGSGIVDDFAIAQGRCLDVHGHVVKQFVIQQSGQHVGVGPICVEFDFVVERPDLTDEGREVVLKCWFSSRDTHTVQLSPALEKEVEEHRALQSRGVIAYDDQFRIVTVRALEVAPNSKDSSREAAGEVTERQRFEMREVHWRV